MNSSKPYLLRAMHQWISDNAFTPYILVQTSFDGVVLPPEQKLQNPLVLNISYTATGNLVLTNDVVEFNARFSGVSRHIVLPIECILGIYAKENSAGMMFNEEQLSDLFDEQPEKSFERDNKNNDELRKDKPNLTFVK